MLLQRIFKVFNQVLLIQDAYFLLVWKKDVRQNHFIKCVCTS